jgi:protein-S-isoprenylcysteine O-methyltransferase Ste14
MSWWLAGLIAGLAAWFADFFLWSKVFTRGMDEYATKPPAGQPVNMGPMMVKSAVLALVFGVLLALFYRRFMGSLWVQGGGVLAGMEFATILWLPTIALSTLGSGVWYDRVRALLNATFWAWLIRMNVAGIVVGLLVK